jgi:hypothetical protein
MLSRALRGFILGCRLSHKNIGDKYGAEKVSRIGYVAAYSKLDTHCVMRFVHIRQAERLSIRSLAVDKEVLDATRC